MSSELNRILNQDTLRNMAGFRAFRDGYAYFERDQVYGLEERGDSLSAKVLGLYEYQVKLWAEGGALGHHCSCPVGQSEDICKHGVAVALTWLRERNTVLDVSDALRRELDPIKDITAFLATQDRSNLIKLLLKGAESNTRLRHQLLFRSARNRAGDIEEDRFKQYIDFLLAQDTTPDAYADHLDQILDALSSLIADGEAKEAQRLIEYTLGRLADYLASIDDADMSALQSMLDRLQEIYLKACRNGNPEPEALAKRLFDWRLNPNWDMFSDAMATYGDMLGAHGLRTYRMLAEEAWEKEPMLKPGDPPPERYGRRFRLAYIMETLARQDNDLNRLVAIKSKDLSQPASFLALAALYKKADQGDQALLWAEKGIASFSGRPDPRLRDFLIAEYQARGWTDKIAELQKK